MDLAPGEDMRAAIVLPVLYVSIDPLIDWFSPRTLFCSAGLRGDDAEAEKGKKQKRKEKK